MAHVLVISEREWEHLQRCAKGEMVRSHAASLARLLVQRDVLLPHPIERTTPGERRLGAKVLDAIMWLPEPEPR